MIQHWIRILLVCFLVSCTVGTIGSFAADKFGQNVTEAMDQEIERARQMRLPYLKETYNPKESVEILEALILQKTDYYRAHFNLGLAYHELDNYPRAKVAFDKALEIRENQDIADNTLINSAGWVSMKQGDYRRAEDLLLEAEKLTKNDGSYTERAVHGNLGELYFLIQNFERSKHYFLIAQEKFGNESASYFLNLIGKTQSEINDVPAL